MDMFIRAGCCVRSMVAVLLIFTVSMVPMVAIAQDTMVGAKINIDSTGAVKVNNVQVYNPDRVLYAESGQIMTDASGQEEEDKWYTPTWGKFLIGLVTIGVVVGICFIVDNNVDDDDDGYWYYDSDCDCYRHHD